jgi:hypothetical protein
MEEVRVTDSGGRVEEGVRELVSRLKALASTVENEGEETVTLDPGDLGRLLDFVEKAVAAAEKAHTLLVHSYSLPDDERGVRYLSEDAVKLQWALREIGIGDDSGQPCFTV